MPAKNDRCGKDWKLSEQQRQQVLEQQAAAEHAEQEQSAYWRLFALFNGKLPIGSNFQNCMGDHFRVEAAGANGEWYQKQMSAEEKTPAFGFVWLPSLPVGEVGMPYIRAPQNPYDYEEVVLVEVGVHKLGRLYDPATGLQWWVIQNKQPILALTDEGNLRYKAKEDCIYDPNCDCFVSLGGGDNSWHWRQPGYFPAQDPQPTEPNFEMLAGDLNGLQNEQLVAQPSQGGFENQGLVNIDEAIAPLAEEQQFDPTLMDMDLALLNEPSQEADAALLPTPPQDCLAGIKFGNDADGMDFSARMDLSARIDALFETMQENTQVSMDLGHPPTPAGDLQFENLFHDNFQMDLNLDPTGALDAYDSLSDVTLPSP